MADENNQNQSTQGNDPASRTPTGEMKDQNPTLTTPSGDQNPEPEPQAKPEARSFLNREPEKKPEPTVDKKPEGDKAPEGDKKPDVASGAPEKYEDFKLPDGYALDPEVAKQATATFKELGLTQEGAQKLIDMYATTSLEAAQAPFKLWADTQQEWINEIDARFGSRAEAIRTDINKGLQAAITSPKLHVAVTQALDLTGAGSNPDLVEALSILVKPFLEGTPVRGNAPSVESQRNPQAQQRPSAAEAIYPHLIPNRGGA